MSPRRRDTLVLAGAGIAAAAAGFMVAPLLLRDSGGEQLWSTPMPDLQGNTRRVEEWRGKVVVCNFWATWCAPCLEEIPLLVTTRAQLQQSGVEIVGIAIDNLPKVAEFAVKFSIPYPILLPGPAGLDLLRAAGNPSGGLPYTLFSDRSGQWVERRLGALQATELQQILAKLVRP